MWLYILSILFLTFVLIYEPSSSRVDVPKLLNNQTYFVSLITLKNNANAPFYYHTSLELIKKGDNLHPDEKISYGFYPDHSSYNSYFNIYKSLGLRTIYRFLRPIYAMPARIRSPDPLYEGSTEQGINPGKVTYREMYPVTEKEWFNLKYHIAHSIIANDLLFEGKNGTLISNSYDMPLFYSYAGTYLSDNCSSWVRKLLNKHLKVEISCQLYRFELFGLHFAAPLSLFDFPAFCSSPSKTIYAAMGYSNTTQKR